MSLAPQLEIILEEELQVGSFLSNKTFLGRIFTYSSPFFKKIFYGLTVVVAQLCTNTSVELQILMEK